MSLKFHKAQGRRNKAIKTATAAQPICLLNTVHSTVSGIAYPMEESLFF